MKNQRSKLKIIIYRYFDNHVPGWIECKFTDGYGKEHIIIEKVPVITTKHLDEHSDYPRYDKIECEILKEWKDANDRQLIRIDLNKPYGIESIDGKSKFDVLKTQLILD